MTAVVLDTHAWVWSMLDMSELQPEARVAIEEAQTVYVPHCSFHKIKQKHRPGKWSEVSPILARLPALLRAQGGVIASYTAEMAMDGVEPPRPIRPDDYGHSDRDGVSAVFERSRV